jgi:hypothetical protein
VLATLGLPVTYDGTRWPELHEAMRVDKKAPRAVLRFVVLDGRPGRRSSPTPAVSCWPRPWSGRRRGRRRRR